MMPWETFDDGNRVRRPNSYGLSLGIFFTLGDTNVILVEQAEPLIGIYVAIVEEEGNGAEKVQCEE